MNVEMWISHKRGQVIWSYRSDSGDGGMCPQQHNLHSSLLLSAGPHLPGYWVFIPSSSSCGQVTTTCYWLQPSSRRSILTLNITDTQLSHNLLPAAKCVNHNFAWCNAEIIMNSVQCQILPTRKCKDTAVSFLVTLHSTWSCCCEIVICLFPCKYIEL